MTDWIVEFHPDALQETEAAKNWYAERSLIASAAFISELNRAVNKITETPEMWPIYIEGCRRYVFPKFPFSLIYRSKGTKIQVIAIAHSKREPGYWKNR
jgi:plasmid stabilization system protein ParE